jgi:hypothetical protein
MFRFRRRLTNVTQRKTQQLLKEVKILSESISHSAQKLTSDTTFTSDIGYDDMEFLIYGLKQLVLISDHCQRIRLLTISPPNWTRRDIANYFCVSE